MNYPARYKSELLNAIEGIDLDKVDQVIEIFRDARQRGRRIFVCGGGGTDFVASQFLCEMVNSAGFNRSSRFRILALSDQLPRVTGHGHELSPDRVFVEQLKNFAEPDDVVVGISASGNSPNVLRAIEYALWIGCRTVAVTSEQRGELSSLAETSIKVMVSPVGGVEDIIICHMIGYYFAEFEKT
jgi:D-sedoheptulose 7-phosphate isomerase